MTASLFERSSGDLPRRRYATLEDYKITWKRPEKVSCVSTEKSGDQGIDVDVNASDIPEIYKRSSEMKEWVESLEKRVLEFTVCFYIMFLYISASDIVKNMFSLKFQPRKETNKMVNTKIMDIVKRHDKDTSSTEVKSNVKL